MIPRPSFLQNQFDSIDLSDNAVVKIEGFPRLLRLKQLLLNNNRVSRIEKKLEGAYARMGLQLSSPFSYEVLPFTETIPNLETLILTNNRISNLQVRGARSSVW